MSKQSRSRSFSLTASKMRAHLRERVAEIAALPRGDLQRDFGLEAGARFVRLVDRARDSRDAGLFARADVGARMRDQKRHAERLASLQLVDQALDRALAQLLVGRAQVEQVGVVRDDHLDPGLGLRAFERLDFLARVGLGGPLARALGENLDAIAADLQAARQRLADAARRSIRARRSAAALDCPKPLRFVPARRISHAAVAAILYETFRKARLPRARVARTRVATDAGLLRGYCGY